MRHGTPVVIVFLLLLPLLGAAAAFNDPLGFGIREDLTQRYLPSIREALGNSTGPELQPVVLRLRGIENLDSDYGHSLVGPLARTLAQYLPEGSKNASQADVENALREVVATANAAAHDANTDPEALLIFAHPYLDTEASAKVQARLRAQQAVNEALTRALQEARLNFGMQDVIDGIPIEEHPDLQATRLTPQSVERIQRRLEAIKPQLLTPLPGYERGTFERDWRRLDALPQDLLAEPPSPLASLYHASPALAFRLYRYESTLCAAPRLERAERMALARKAEGLLQLFADMMARLNPSTALFELRDSIEKIDEELFTGSAWSWNQPAYESWQKVMALAGLLLKNPASDSERTLLARQALMYAAPLAEKYRQQFFEKVEDPSPKAAAPDDEIGRFAADRDITRQHMLKAETARLLRALKALARI